MLVTHTQTDTAEPINWDLVLLECPTTVIWNIELPLSSSSIIVPWMGDWRQLWGSGQTISIASRGGILRTNEQFKQQWRNSSLLAPAIIIHTLSAALGRKSHAKADEKASRPTLLLHFSPLQKVETVPSILAKDSYLEPLV